MVTSSIVPLVIEWGNIIPQIEFPARSLNDWVQLLPNYLPQRDLPPSRAFSYCWVGWSHSLPPPLPLPEGSPFLPPSFLISFWRGKLARFWWHLLSDFCCSFPSQSAIESSCCRGSFLQSPTNPSGNSISFSSAVLETTGTQGRIYYQIEWRRGERIRPYFPCHKSHPNGTLLFCRGGDNSHKAAAVEEEIPKATPRMGVSLHYSWWEGRLESPRNPSSHCPALFCWWNFHQAHRLSVICRRDHRISGGRVVEEGWRKGREFSLRK